MPRLIYFRIFGYVFTLIMHSVNAAIMMNAVKPDLLVNDAQNRIMASLQPYYITVWNVTCQILYASLGLICDVLSLMNKQDILPKFVGTYRRIFFEAVVFPITLFIFIIFWPVFIYDRNLIFPDFIDRVFSSKSNYVIHIYIVPVVLWELLFQPKRQPKSHKLNILIIIMYYIVYVSVLFYDYHTRGQWLYQILALTYGTIYFGLLISSIVILSIISYYIQWRIVSFVWGHKKLNNKIQ